MRVSAFHRTGPSSFAVRGWWWKNNPQFALPESLIEHWQLAANGSVDGTFNFFFGAIIPNGTAPDTAQKRMPCVIVEKIFYQWNHHLVFLRHTPDDRT